jgi:hypothetical protein
MKRRVIQTSWDSTTQLGSSWAMQSCLGDESPRETNVIEIVDEHAEVLLLGTQWDHSKIAPIFSLRLMDE